MNLRPCISGSGPERDRRAEAVAQFAMLLHARSKDDYPAAAEADRRLRDLGVAVKLRGRCFGEGGGR